MPKDDIIKSSDSSVRRSVPGRELIDARGSIDSRTFDEEHRISPVAKDDRDRHAASVDVISSRTHWHSRSSQSARTAFGDTRRLPTRGAKTAPKQQSGVGFTRSVLSGPADYTPPSKLSSSNVPVIKIVAAAAIILLVIAAIALVVL